MIDIKIDSREKSLKRGGFPMTEMLERDRTGKCAGEWKDRVREGEEERQAQINADSFDSPLF